MPSNGAPQADKHKERIREQIGLRVMDIVHDALDRRGYTQAQIARLVGIATSSMHDWVEKKPVVVPKPEGLAAVVREFGVNGHWVLTGFGAPNDKTTPYEVIIHAVGLVLNELRDVLSAWEQRYLREAAGSKHAPSQRTLDAAKKEREAKEEVPSQHLAKGVEKLAREKTRSALTPGRRKSARKRRKA